MNDTARTSKGTGLPPVVSHEKWQLASEKLREEEKSLTRRLDALVAKRRRLPMVEVEKSYRFTGPSGSASLLDIFEGRSQLVVYHFMFHPDWDEGCEGCSWFVDGFAHPAHIESRDVSFALVSRAPYSKLAAYQERMGWTAPWYSSHGSDFNHDFHATVGDSEHHSLSVFLRDGERIFHTYQTFARGVENLGTAFSLLDLVPYGRQEKWQDSPEGWPQGDPYVWWRRHDSYGDLPAPSVVGRHGARQAAAD
ncbi:MAG TPA: DUF899 domain-containing protein [Trueperaceae bacterium]|nr:DUF899 domain-containing protein [Trueperaceae bacterium]